MNLSFRITSRISLALLVLMAVWAALFYFIVIEEINDETDDSLEDYSENIIMRSLAGEALPSEDNGTNNSYHITEVSATYAAQTKTIRYYDETVYIRDKHETEPARVLKTIFIGAENRHYELTVAVPTIEKEDLQEAILHWTIFLYLLLLLAIIAINWWILHQNFKPLYALLKWLDGFSVERQLVEPNIHTKTSEFRKLNDAIVRSARRNIETYEQQKSFIAHASHELQTPLAICRNRLELMLEDSLLTEKQLDEISKVQQSLDHIIKLNKTLLLLTKIENNQFPEKKEVSVNALVAKLVEDYTEVYAEQNISVSVHADAGLRLSMNESLAAILFGNLIKNAFVHNHKNGQIHIHIGSTSFSITNTGAAETLDTSAIFERFYQGARKKEGSTGLGLALSKSICKLYNISIRYQFSEKKHLFTLSL